MAHAMPQVEGIRHEFVRVGDLSVHAAIAGEGEPILLYHDWPQHWYAWRRVIPLLAERHRVIAVDIRGFGWSDIAWQGFDTETLVDDVFGLMDGLELDRARFVGHGIGGWIGFAAALRDPERIERLCAIGSLPPWLRPTPANLLALTRLYRQAAVALPLLGPQLCRRRPFVRGTIRRWTTARAKVPAEARQLYARDIRASTRARAATLLHRRLLARELLPVLLGRYRGRRLRTPTLVLHGRRDFVRPRLVATPTMPADDLRVDLVRKAGHLLPEERPGLVAERVLDFFAEPESAELALGNGA